MHTQESVRMAPLVFRVKSFSKVLGILREAPLLPLLIIILVVLSAIFADVLAPYNPEVSVKDASGRPARSYLPPFWMKGGSLATPLGTDFHSRDILSRLLYGARVSLLVGVVGTPVAGALGTFLGVLAGYLGRWVDQMIMRITDAWLALPTLTFAIFLTSVLKPSLWNIIAILGLVFWSRYARIIRSPERRLYEYPHQMSGGMRQRIVGAMALARGPKLIVADEPTTNLDVTIQLQYLNLLKELQRQTGIALIFVTHDLGIVAKMCDNVAVMYAGKIVEQGSVREIYYHPKHPYTEGLLKSVPRVGSKDLLYVIPGQPPDLANLPIGCAFAPRCSCAMERCLAEEPRDYAVAPGHTSRCWLPVQEGQYSQHFSGSP